MVTRAKVAAPCRHADPPPTEVVDRVIALISGLENEDRLLTAHGLSPDEYRRALPAAIEAERGRKSATTVGKQEFLMELFKAMERSGAIDHVTEPRRGERSIYRLAVPGIGPVAIIRKGCPDGDHNKGWQVPDWAQETYLWWLCSSTVRQPGEHVAKGVGRLKTRFLSDAPDTLDGVVFGNELCGTAERLCPKAANAVEVNGNLVPPPCIYVMPDKHEGVREWNWKGETSRRFPSVLLRFFGIEPNDADMYTGHVGFQAAGDKSRIMITARAGLGMSDTYRS